MRRKPRERDPGPCPTPTKALYRTAEEAAAAALGRDDAARRVPLKAYRCRCGFWHLASDWE